MAFGGKPNIDKLKQKRDVKGLIKALEYRDSDYIRREAVRALGGLRDERVLAPLVAILGKRETRSSPHDLKTEEVQEVRESAALQLAIIGDARAIEPLKALLAVYPDRLVATTLSKLGWVPDNGQTGAAYWLAMGEWDRCVAIGAPAVPPLMAILRRSKDMEVHSRVVASLRSIGGPQAVEALIETIREREGKYLTSERIREKAARALGEIGDASAVPALLHSLQQPDSTSPRSAVIESLGKIGTPQALEAQRAAINKYLAGLESETAMWAACNALKDHGETQLVGTMIQGLTVERDLTKAKRYTHILDGLGWKPDRGEGGIAYWIVREEWKKCVEIGAPAVGRLMEALKVREDFVSRRDIIVALGEIGDPRAIDLLLSILWSGKGASAGESLTAVFSGPGKSVQQHALEALIRIGDPRGVEPLVEPLIDALRGKYSLTAADLLIRIRDPRVPRPLIEFIRETAFPSVRRLVADLLETLGEQPAWDALVAVYWTSRTNWHPCAELRSEAIPVLEAVVNVSGVGESDRQGAAKALAQVGEGRGTEILAALLRNRDRRIRAAASGALKEVGWQPAKDNDRAAYWIATRDWDRLAELDDQAIKPFLAKIMDWEMDRDDWHVKAQVAKLLVHDGLAADEPTLARAADELDRCAKRYADILDQIVQHTSYSLRVLSAWFEDYANLIDGATEYAKSEKPDGAGGTTYSYDTSGSLAAVEAICGITTPVATNLLHHLSRLGNVEVTTSTFEVEHDYEHPSGMGARTDVLSYKPQRGAAMRELARRGNPDYDLSAYKAKGCWRIPRP